MDECLEKWANKEDGVYYFGYEDCPWCQDAIPILKEVAQSQNQSVYYIRTRDSNHELLYDERQKEELKLEEYKARFLERENRKKMREAARASRRENVKSE